MKVVVSGLDVEVRQDPHSFRAPLPCLFDGSCGNVFLHIIQFEHDRFLLIVMVLWDYENDVSCKGHTNV